MKKIGFVIFVCFLSSVFCPLWVSSVLYAQDETIRIISYYPAPYGVYQDLETRDSLEITNSSFEKMLFSYAPAPLPDITGRLGSNDLAMGISTNAYLNESNDNWYCNYQPNPSFLYIQHIDNLAHEFCVRTANDPPDDPDPYTTFWTRAMVIDARGRVGIGETTPRANKLAIKTTVNSVTAGVENLPVRIRKNDDTNNQGTGIGFTCSTYSPNIGAKIAHIRRDTQSEGDLAFFTKPDTVAGDTTTEKMRIRANGRVGIGITGPRTDRLDISTTVNSLTAGVENLPVRIWNECRMSAIPESVGIGFTCSTNTNNIGARILHIRTDYESHGDLAFWTKSGTGSGDITSEKMRITAAGRVGIGIPNPGYTLTVVGTATPLAAKSVGGTAWDTTSDIRLKKDIKPIINPLNKIVQLRGVTYKWKEPEKHCNMTGTYMGLISQDVEKVFPEWVGTDTEGYKTLGLIGFEALVIEAIKELKIENDLVESKNVQLEERIKKLEKINKEKIKTLRE